MSRPKARHNPYMQERLYSLIGIILPTLFIVVIGLGYSIAYKSAVAGEVSHSGYAADYKQSVICGAENLD